MQARSFPGLPAAVPDVLPSPSCDTGTAATQAISGASKGIDSPTVPTQSGSQGRAVGAAPTPNATHSTECTPQAQNVSEISSEDAAAATPQVPAQIAQLVESVPETMGEMAPQSSVEGAVVAERVREVPIAAVLQSYILPGSEEEL